MATVSTTLFLDAWEYLMISQLLVPSSPLCQFSSLWYYRLGGTYAFFNSDKCRPCILFYALKPLAFIHFATSLKLHNHLLLTHLGN